MSQSSIVANALITCVFIAIEASAQTPVPPPALEVQLRSSAELDQMLGPIALYPDPLIAQILPAATLPSQIVLADRYVNGGGDPNLIDQQGWDPSIEALARYPDILKWMDESLVWTTALGQAFLYQQQDVMDSIQRLRAQAQALGNLQTTPQENVITDDGNIEILPADPQVIYVPVYQPQIVYFERPFAGPLVSFGAGLGVGAWLDHDFDWHNHHLIVWGHEHPRPADWWSRRPNERPRPEAAPVRVWQPHPRPNPEPRDIDRGWASPPVHNALTVIDSRPAPAARPAPVTVPHTAETTHSIPANGALIGVRSSLETRQFSSRGQESRQVMVARPTAPPPHVAAPVHSEPAPHAAGGGRR